MCGLTKSQIFVEVTSIDSNLPLYLCGWTFVKKKKKSILEFWAFGMECVLMFLLPLEFGCNSVALRNHVNLIKVFVLHLFVSHLAAHPVVSSVAA